MAKPATKPNPNEPNEFERRWWRTLSCPLYDHRPLSAYERIAAKWAQGHVMRQRCVRPN